MLSPALHIHDRSLTGSSLWRLASFGLALLTLCSCRSAPPRQQPPCPPQAAWGGDPQQGLTQAQLVDVMGNPLPLPYEAHGDWVPPGIARPWPADEYLHDGGDTNFGAQVAPDWQTYGIDSSDTVLHFDTIDGRTLVEPSNRVNLYAPRFGAVRTVARIADSKQYDKIGVEGAPEGLVQFDDKTPVLSSLQRLSPVGQENAEMANAYDTRKASGTFLNSIRVYGFQHKLLPFEDFKVVRCGIFEDAEKARLAKSADAAITWTSDQGVVVLVDEIRATPVVKIDQPEVVFTAEDLTCNPKVRVLKMASTQTAKPGEVVDFTIRFDNIGDQPVGNLVLIDNLTTRLEYVPNSAQASVETTFSHEANQGGSLVLRWQVTEPLKPGDGGLVRFQCRVR